MLQSKMVRKESFPNDIAPKQYPRKLSEWDELLPLDSCTQDPNSQGDNQCPKKTHDKRNIESSIKVSTYVRIIIQVNDKESRKNDRIT